MAVITVLVCPIKCEGCVVGELLFDVCPIGV